MRAAVRAILADSDVRDEVFEGAFYALSYQEHEDPAVIKREILQILTDSRLTRFAETQGFMSYLEDAIETLGGDAEFAGAFKSSLFPVLFEVQNEMQRAGLGNLLLELIDQNDASRANALLESNSPALNRIGIGIAAKAGYADRLQPRLMEMLEDNKNSLEAAKALARSGNEKALDILIEKGLKKMGAYSSVTVEAEYFVPYGEVAEKRLIELLDYPNRSTRAAVRMALATMKSEEALKHVRREFEQAIAAKEIPEPHLIAALMLFGDEPWPAIVDLAQSMEDLCECRFDDYELSEAGMLDKSLEQLQSLLIATSDEKRAQAIIHIIESLSPDSKRRAEVLRSARDRHSDAKIRNIIDQNMK